MIESLDRYQFHARRTLDESMPFREKMLLTALGLNTEAGEYGEHAKKIAWHGKSFSDRREAMIEELGDVLWYLAGCATTLGIDLSDVATRNIDKLLARRPVGEEFEIDAPCPTRPGTARRLKSIMRAVEPCTVKECILDKGHRGYCERAPTRKGEDTLPEDSDERKDLPLASGVLDYFPAALMEVAHLSKVGNDKHNPGEDLHWARGKSMDHADCILRHLVDRGKVDTDGISHSVKVAWRALALLQQELEAAGAPMARGAR